MASLMHLNIVGSIVFQLRCLSDGDIEINIMEYSMYLY